jgi:hypothetical protein
MITEAITTATMMGTTSTGLTGHTEAVVDGEAVITLNPKADSVALVVLEAISAVATPALPLLIDLNLKYVRKSATYATNPTAGQRSILLKNAERHLTNSANLHMC